MKKKKFELKSFLLILSVGLAAAACFLPKYLWTVERAKAGSIEAVLVNLSIAQNKYFEKARQYTYDWNELTPHISTIIKSQGFFAPAPEPGEERFYGFTQKSAEAGRNGFSLGIELNEDKTQGRMYAVRAGSLIDYTLTEEIAHPAFSCESDGRLGKWFCEKFSAYIAPFLMRGEDASPAPESVDLQENSVVKK